MEECLWFFIRCSNQGASILMFKNKKIKKFKNSKKGSLVLSIMASGAVAASIVASHQIAQNFVSGVGQGRSYQEALLTAQQALSLASLMVSRNIVLCSVKNGCSTQGSNIQDATTVTFFNKLNLADSFFSRLDKDNDGQDDTLKLSGVNRTGSPLFMVSRSDSGRAKGSVVWSLRNWQQDPSVRAIFSSNKQMHAPFYECRKTTDNSIVSDGTCGWHHSLSLNDVMNRDIPCKNSSGADISNTKCHFLHDNDGEMVFISVTIPYVEGTEGGGSVQQKLILNGAIRRPFSNISIMGGDNPPVCSLRCEATGDGGLGLNDNPMCAGLSDYGVNVASGDVNTNTRMLASDVRYSEDALLTEHSFAIKNYGPGVLYDVRFHREDFETATHRVLYKTMVDTTAENVYPYKTVDVQDFLPCYVSSYYQLSATKLNCRCSLQGANASARADAICNDMSNVVNGVRSLEPVRILKSQVKTWQESLQAADPLLASTAVVCDDNSDSSFVYVPQTCIISNGDAGEGLPTDPAALKTLLCNGNSVATFNSSATTNGQQAVLRTNNTGVTGSGSPIRNSMIVEQY